MGHTGTGRLEDETNIFQVMMTGDPRNSFGNFTQNSLVLPEYQPKGVQQKLAPMWQIGLQENIDLKAPGVRDAKPGRSGAISTGWDKRTNVYDNNRTIQTAPWLNWEGFEWLWSSDWNARRGAYMYQMLLDSDQGNKALNKDTGVFTPSPYPFTALRFCKPVSSTPLL